MPLSCTSSSVVIFSQQRHQMNVAVLSVHETFLPQQPLADESAFVVAADRAKIVGESGQPQSIQVHFVERQANHYSERVGAKALVPALFLADRDEELGLTALPVDKSDSGVADQLSVERFDR